MNIKCELFNDHFQNYKRYAIPSTIVLADIPYNSATMRMLQALNGMLTG